MSIKKYKIGIEVKSVDYHTVEIEMDESICNDIDFVLDELEREGRHPDDIKNYLSGTYGIKILKTEIEEAGTCEIECPDINEI